METFAERAERLGVSYETKTIAGFSGHPMSGLWQLNFTDGSFVHIESGCGARAIANCFGSLEAAKGKTIHYTCDEMLGTVMEGFTPTEEDDDEH